MEFSIRNLVPSDVEAANRILESAFGPSGSRKNDLLNYLQLQPDGWLAAETGGEIVGTVGTVDWGPFAWVGFMAVQPQKQRHGIGRSLLARLLSMLDSRGCPMVLLDATEAGAPLYRSAGFQVDGHSLTFQLEQDPLQLNSQITVSRLQPEHIPLIAALDTPFYGADRSRLFKILLHELPERAYIAWDSKAQPSGFLFAQQQKIGPWVAGNQGAAEALLATALELSFEKAPRVILPDANASGQELLMKAGFRNIDSHKHMRRAGPNHPGQRSQIYGQTSFALG